MIGIEHFIFNRTLASNPAKLAFCCGSVDDLVGVRGRFFCAVCRHKSGARATDVAL
jgi:hypothetical protein